MIHVKTRYLDDDAHVQFGHYANGDIAIQLISDIGEPLSTATVNLEEYGIRPQKGNIIIKDNNENAGMVETFKHNGIITDVIRSFSYGYVVAGAYECVLSDEWKTKIPQ